MRLKIGGSGIHASGIYHSRVKAGIIIIRKAIKQRFVSIQNKIRMVRVEK